MTKEVELQIKGFQKYDTYEDSDLETKVTGEYYFRNHCHYVMYEEVTEGFTQPVKSMLKLKADSLEMTRRGLVNTGMVFDKNHKTTTKYQTPFGEFLLEIGTKTLEISETEDEIRAKVEYTLGMDGRHMSDNRINIRIKAMDK